MYHKLANCIMQKRLLEYLVNTVLSLENELFATLVRLLLGLPSKDCALRFGISESAFSVIFNTWVILLVQHTQLELIGQMPSSEKTSPYQAACFDNFVMCLLFWIVLKFSVKPLGL